MAKMTRQAVVGVLLLGQLLTVTADKPCWRVDPKENRSVCMCTAEYCDEVTRETPTAGTYVTYTSSEDGLRFHKKVEYLQSFRYEHPDGACPAKSCTPALYLDSSTLYQTIEGFGGAVTDAASIMWKSLKSEELKQHLIDSYYSDRGLEYNMMRVPIGGCDFSTHAYAYNELPVGDAGLTNFTLTKEDYDLKLPMIKRCMDVAPEEVHVLATTWSPPGWMKSNNALTGSPSALREEYYQTYADYHLRFLEEYQKEGVPVWGITTTNEPTNAVSTDSVAFNSLGWMATHQAKWIAENLGPTIRNSAFKDIKIVCNDDQRSQLTYYFNLFSLFAPEAYDYIDGVGVHYYLDTMVSPDLITYSMRDHPDKFIISTEACTGSASTPTGTPGVDLGSWERADMYITNILENLNHNLTGWIDWNLCLDEKGGPNWVGNLVDSPIIVSDDGQKIYKQPMYYALGHVAKFLPRGSRRVKVETLCAKKVDNVAFLTPEGTVVTVLHNPNEATVVQLVTCNRLAEVYLEKNSISTVEFVNEDCY